MALSSDITFNIVGTSMMGGSTCLWWEDQLDKTFEVLWTFCYTMDQLLGYMILFHGTIHVH